MRGSVLGYRPDIDGLRAIAVLSVIVFHANHQILPGGFVGVDIFFVISGYLISGIILDLLSQEKFSLIDFYAHRVRRIFPALLLMLGAVMAIGWVLLYAAEYQQLGLHASAGALFFSNFVFFKEVSYFDNQSYQKPLLHLWSLGIEEQFYIAWPLVLLFAWRYKVSISKLIVSLVVISFAFCVLNTYRNAPAAFYLPIYRAWELLIGCGIAYLHAYKFKDKKELIWNTAFTVRNTQRKQEIYRGFASLLGGGLVVLSILSFDKTVVFPGWRALIPVVGAAILIGSGPNALVNRIILRSRPVVFIGLVSYPLYLWHWPLLSLARIAESGEPPIVIMFSVILLSIVFAVLTYFFVERPIRRRPARSQAPWLLIVMGLVAIFGFAEHKNSGIPTRYKDRDEKLAEIKWALESQVGCQTSIPVKTRYCRIGDESKEPTAVIIGDSHGNRLFDGVSPLFLQEGGNLLQIGEGGCAPIWNVRGGVAGSSDTCLARINQQIGYVVRTHSIKTVFLASRGPLYMTGRGYGAVETDTRTFLEHHLRADLSYKDTFELGLRDSVRMLMQAGKRVVFVIDNPELGFDPLSCIRSRPLQLTSKIREPCAVPRRVVDERNKAYRDLIGRLVSEFPSLHIVDTHKTLCDSEYCWAMADGELLYMDGDHLNKYGTAKVASQMSKALFQ